MEKGLSRNQIRNNFTQDKTINVPGDAATLQDAIDQAYDYRMFGEAEKVTINVADGSYNLTEAMIIDGSKLSNMVIEIIGNEATPSDCTFTSPVNLNGLNVRNGARVIVKGFKFSGSNTDQPNSGLSCSSNSYLEVSDCECTGFNKGVHITHLSEGKLTDVTCDSNVNGFEIEHKSLAYLKNVQANGNSATGLLVVTSEVNIEGATCSNNIYTGMLIYKNGSAYLHTAAVTCNNNGGDGIEVNGCSTLRMASDIPQSFCNDNGVYGIDVTYTSQAHVYNMQMNDTGFHGLGSLVGSYVHAEGCTMNSNDHSGVVVIHDAGARVESCTVDGNTSYGVYAQEGSVGFIRSSGVHNNSLGGLLSSHGSFIRSESGNGGNAFSGNGGFGNFSPAADTQGNHMSYVRTT